MNLNREIAIEIATQIDKGAQQKMTAQHIEDPFAGGDSVPSVSFKDTPVGTSFTGVVTKAPELVQARDYESGQPAFWSDGNPKMTVVTRLEINGEERALWAAKPSAMFRAIADAQKAAGAQIAVGGRLTITFSGEKPNDNPRLNPQKLYTAVYAPPNPFQDEQVDPWARQPQQPAPAWTPPSSASVSTPPQRLQYTPEQYAAAKAAGIKLPGMDDEPPF